MSEVYQETLVQEKGKPASTQIKDQTGSSVSCKRKSVGQACFSRFLGSCSHLRPILRSASCLVLNMSERSQRNQDQM